MASIAVADAARAVESFINDLASQYQAMDVATQLVERAASLAETHGLRGYYAVQLATALEASDTRDSLGLPKLVFVSPDENLTRRHTAKR